MAARRFLWVIAILTFLVIAAAFAYRLFAPQLFRLALVPGRTFAESPVQPEPVYGVKSGWLARPDLPGNPALWTPPGIARAGKPRAAAFFIAPTAYLSRDRWNAPLDDAATNARLALFLRGQASVFNGVATVWAPRYRQATFGAFLTSEADARRALDFAYADVVRAFDAFLAANPAGPIILAGHSQGSLHLLRLLKEQVAGTPVAARVVAAYAGGWPVSVTADLPALGMPQCAGRAQSGCLLAWQSWAEPIDASMVTEVFDASAGLTGAPRRGTAMVCTNPLIGGPGEASPAANLGSLVPSGDLKSGTLVARGIGATCIGRGLLSIGAPPGGFGSYVLPGNNYHVYDYALFWANLRADAAARLAAWTEAHPRP